MDARLGRWGWDGRELRNHWYWRPGWGVGTRYYTFHLTFEEAPELSAEAERYRPALGAFPQRDLVPDAWLHLTMTGVGFAQDVSADDLDAVADQVWTGLEALKPEPLVLDSGSSTARAWRWRPEHPTGSSGSTRSSKRPCAMCSIRPATRAFTRT